MRLEGMAVKDGSNLFHDIRIYPLSKYVIAL